MFTLVAEVNRFEYCNSVIVAQMGVGCSRNIEVIKLAI